MQQDLDKALTTPTIQLILPPPPCPLWSAPQTTPDRITLYPIRRRYPPRIGLPRLQFQLEDSLAIITIIYLLIHLFKGFVLHRHHRNINNSRCHHYQHIKLKPMLLSKCLPVEALLSKRWTTLLRLRPMTHSELLSVIQPIKWAQLCPAI